MKISRNASQEKAMTIIYDILLYEEMGFPYDVKEVISDHMEDSYEETDIYVREVVIKALLHQEEIILEVEPELKKWKFKRLNHLAQAIFLLSVSHYKYVKGVEKPVVIDIAVSLAKKYLDAEDYKFINAVLDHIL